MFKKIIWTELAEITYYENLEYLNNKWCPKQALEFIDQVDEITQKIAKGLVIFKKYENDERINVAFINRHISLYYNIINSEIYLLFFWNNNKEPKKKEYYLKK